MPNLEGHPPPTNLAFTDHSEKTLYDNDMEKFGNGPDIGIEYAQQRASLEAERAVVRKLDWRVCSLNYFF